MVLTSLDDLGQTCWVHRANHLNEVGVEGIKVVLQLCGNALVAHSAQPVQLRAAIRVVLDAPLALKQLYQLG